MIDLRSDTVTKPTEEMRKAMYEAEVGDDVYGEDPTVNKLEKRAAQMLGKEDALFVTSGTQGNQIAVLTHCQPGNEIILEEESHVFYYEGAGISALAGVQPRTVKGKRGNMTVEAIKAAIRPVDIHMPKTGLIILENTHNRAGGAVYPLEDMKNIYQLAQEKGIPVHIDGARLFNAAVASDVALSEYGRYSDTIQVCLSKGLGAPVGSVIAGSKEFIEEARRWRKMLGGGLRQVGVLAAPGLVALDNMIDRLSHDHKKARVLAEGISTIKGLSVKNNVETNIVVVDISESGKNVGQWTEKLKENGVLAVAFGENLLRFVTHYDVSEEEIQRALSVLNKIAG
ncbi:low-specificity L-threonine aldolase [Pseudalkalibacillus caeni]|uniref:Low-specificity L-threonine aldolase n=1 Tax=Exobacillus caeni TaxID=2574798 RepID=A0A5R9F5F0_9BACL|nr:low-specificity L-threonine aldolase [Pseudalkalibacillus caeni]TLS38261.1 low-specificity L-threonine aldolase [Pseudalkalibacillus caeni]